MMDEIRPGRMGDFYSFNPYNETMPHDSFFFSFFRLAHTTIILDIFRVDAAEYITCVFSFVTPLTVCSPLNPQQDLIRLLRCD